MNLQSSSWIDVSEQASPKTYYNDVATPPAARDATCKDITGPPVNPVTVLNVDDTEITTATSESAAGAYYNVDTSYDDVATPPAARGTTCKDITGPPVDPVTVLNVDDTEITATSESAAGAYYNVDTSYDDVATPPAALGANDVTEQPVNPDITVEETEKNAIASRPMSDMTQYQQLVSIHDQQGIHVVFFPKYQYEILFL